MKDHLAKIDALIARLDGDTLAALSGITTTERYKKGDFLLRQDEVCRCSFHVEEGVLRKFYLHDGKEITTELLFPGDLAVALTSYTLQMPGREFIQALTEVTVSQTDYRAFQDAKALFPRLTELDLMVTEHYAMWLEQRQFEFHTLDATQRYLRLLNEQPHIIQHIPLKYVASYLGISLETLSRIRARI